MGCGYHTGQFIAFGGSSGTNVMTTMHNNLPVVYNVDTSTWSTNFDPKGPGSGSNIGAIAGGAAGGVALLIICGVGAFCFVKRKKAKQDQEAREADARAVALVADNDDDVQRDERAYLDKHKYNDIISSSGSDVNGGGEGGGGGKAMSAADHYAAAVALQSTINKNTSPAARAASRNSDAYSQGVSEHDYTALMPMGNVRALSEISSQPEANCYYQQLQLQQLQQQQYQQQFQQQQQLYTNQNAFASMSAVSPQHASITPSQSYALAGPSPHQSFANSDPSPNPSYSHNGHSPHQTDINAFGGYPISTSGEYTTVPVMIQQQDGAIQGPHSWTGSYYDTRPISGGPIPAVPPIPYVGGGQQQQPWIPSGGYYGTTTAASAPTTPGYPPAEYSQGYAGGNNNYNEGGHDNKRLSEIPSRGPQAVAPGAPTDYVRPPQ